VSSAAVAGWPGRGAAPSRALTCTAGCGIVPPHTVPTAKRQQIITGLKELLAQHKQLKAPLDRLAEDSRLSQIGFDSITILDFLYDIETRFGVQVEMTDLIHMDRVQDLIDYLETRWTG
jgi:acyl carrier protein